MLPVLAHSAVGLLVSVGPSAPSAVSATVPSVRCAHVCMNQGTESFRDTRVPYGQDVPRPVSQTRRRDVFAATDVFADDSIVPNPWVSERAASDPYGTGGLMLPKGQSRYSAQQRGDAAARDAERRALACGPDQAAAGQVVPTQTVPAQAPKTRPVPSATSIDQRARELAQDAVEAYFADEIDEAELNRLKLSARQQASAELAAQQGEAEEAAQAALLKKAYVDSLKQSHAAAMSVRVAAEEALAKAVRAEEEAARRVEEAINA